MEAKYKQALEGMCLAFMGGPFVGFACGILYQSGYSLIYGLHSTIRCNSIITVSIGLLVAFIYHFAIERVKLAPFVAFVLNFVLAFSLMLSVQHSTTFVILYVIAYILTIFFYDRTLELQLKTGGEECQHSPKSS